MVAQVSSRNLGPIWVFELPFAILANRQHMDDWPLTSTFLWDQEGRFLAITWEQLKEKMWTVTNGFSVAVSDLIYLVQYDMGSRRHRSRREAYSEILASARSEKDLRLIADIVLAAIVQHRTLEAAWMIILLETEDRKHYDYQRQANVLNNLHKCAPHQAIELIRLLDAQWRDWDPVEVSVIDVMRNQGFISEQIAQAIAQVSVFISYAREDADTAENLRSSLLRAGLKAWKDTHEILPGENFEVKIKTALETADCAIICLSKTSVAKVGFVQVELNECLKWQRYRPDTKVYLIPVRLDDCVVPWRIRELNLHCEDLFTDWDAGIRRIKAVIHKHFR
jgi:hypothetical protein